MLGYIEKFKNTYYYNEDGKRCIVNDLYIDKENAGFITIDGKTYDFNYILENEVEFFVENMSYPADLITIIYDIFSEYCGMNDFVWGGLV